MATSNPSPMLSAPIPLLMRKIGLPVSIGAFFNTMFNVVDTIYGGLISDQALAALSLSFPIYFIIVAIGFGFSQGTTALMGNALGRGDQARAQQYGVQGVILGLLLSVVVTGLVLLVAPSLVAIMGATDPAYQQMALSYINVIFYGTIFFLTVQMLSAVLNTVGKTIPGRNFLIAGFLLNLVLDPWFIFGGFGLPPLGITGIALATIFVQFLGCLYIGYEVAKDDLITAASVRKFWRPDWRVMWRIITQGFPNMLDMMGVSLGFFVLTVYTSQFGQKAVAALGAASRIEQILLLPLLGLNVSVLALVARNNGAGRADRVQMTYQTSLRYGAGIMAVTTLLAVVLARPLMNLFTDDATIIAVGVSYARIRTLGLVPNAIFFMSASALRGIERPFIPLVLNLIRFVGLPWLLIHIFVQWLNYGITAIWVTSTVAFFITAVIGWLVARQMLPQPAVD